jgi:hypothetical protein
MDTDRPLNEHGQNTAEGILHGPLAEIIVSRSPIFFIILHCFSSTGPLARPFGGDHRKSYTLSPDRRDGRGRHRAHTGNRHATAHAAGAGNEKIRGHLEKTNKEVRGGRGKGEE